MLRYDTLYDLLEAFPDEESCIAHLETQRWPDGVTCPWADCGYPDAYRIRTRRLYKCAQCRRQFSVRKGTVFESSKLPLRKWFMAIWMLMDNPKGVAARRLADQIGVTHKTAWFLLHRLRHVAASVNLGFDLPVDQPVEADETYVGGKFGRMHAKRRRELGSGMANKTAVIGFKARSDQSIRLEVLPSNTTESIKDAARRTLTPRTTLFSDGAYAYTQLGYRHESVAHDRGEYVRGSVHTNGIESAWGVLKRSYMGVYHYMSEKHLPRYLAELEARWNMRELRNGEKLDRILAGSVGVRLTWDGLIGGELWELRGRRSTAS